jgi:hypothetical protein
MHVYSHLKNTWLHTVLELNTSDITPLASTCCLTPDDTAPGTQRSVGVVVDPGSGPYLKSTWLHTALELNTSDITPLSSTCCLTPDDTAPGTQRSVGAVVDPGSGPYLRSKRELFPSQEPHATSRSSGLQPSRYICFTLQHFESISCRRQ